MNKKILLGFILFLIGLAGVASMLTMEMPIPEEAKAILEQQFTPEQIKFVLLLNPTILVLIMVVVGTIFYDKAGLKVPIIERAIGLQNHEISVTEIFKFGVIGGVLSGVLIMIVSLIFTPMLPAEFQELGESMELSLAARFLYGGLTEEIMMRFGFMSFIVWLFSKIFKELKPIVYWLGIAIAAVVFALGHFPIAFQAVENPSTELLTYILIGNTIGGLIFGWLYWKKGLEAAFVAHIFAHVVMVLVEPLVG
ncbi:MAG: CPBP family intramembrane glutamic endopeptidase [Saprospiraceae bacterium]